MSLRRLKGDTIYFPASPSKWIGIREQKPALKLTITAGGGMGGSRWTRFVHEQAIGDGLCWYETINGNEIMINDTYIVEVEKVDVITAEYLCNNSNFGYDNTLCKVTVYTDSGADVVLRSKYKEEDKWLYR